MQRIEELEHRPSSDQAQLFIETPYRNPALWQALAAVQPNTRLVMASS